MPKRDDYDAVVVGAGPNGLAAAITLGRRFKSVLLLEAAETIGGGARSKALTLPGFIHDVCSTVQPLSLASSFFQQLDLPQYGLEWMQPEIPLAHPFEDGSALFLHRSLEVTADALGADGRAYRRLLQPFVDHEQKLLADILKPLHFPGKSPPDGPLCLPCPAFPQGPSGNKIQKRSNTRPLRRLGRPRHDSP